MTEQSFDYLWTFDDYQQRLHHENYFVRHWAFNNIEEQYPDQKTQAAALLIGDSNRHLNIEAIRALGKLGGEANEQRLLALYSTTDDPNQRSWLTLALAEMRSPRFLSQLLAEMQALDLSTFNTRLYSVAYPNIEALGFYNEPTTTALLWQLLESHSVDDRFTGHVVTALLKHPEPTTVPRILQRWQQLTPQDKSWSQVGGALAAVIEQERLFEGLPYETDLPAQWKMIAEWFEQPVALPAAVEAAVTHFAAATEADTTPDPSALLAAYWQAMQATAAARGDDPVAWLTTWSAGATPSGYQARTLYCWQALETLTTLSGTTAADAQQAAFVVYATLLFAHYLVDENDEQKLVALQDEDAQQDALLEILASPRKIVLADIVAQVAAFGPAVVPQLVALLSEERLWSTMRALQAIEKIARAHPGGADSAADAVLDLLRDDDQGDFITEAAADTLRAIGPAVIAPAVANWPDHFTYDIFVTNVLANIPVQASVDILEARLRAQETMTELEWGSLVDLGQLQSIALIREHFDGEHPHIATALYTIGALHDLADPAMELWGRLADAEEKRLEAIHRAMTTGGPMPPVPEVLRRGNPLWGTRAGRSDDEEGTDPSRDSSPAFAAERKAKKKKRNMVKATKKAQRKAKKKKKR